MPSQDAYWFAPVPRPGKIVCVGLNYRDHAEESKLAVPQTPVIFSKFSSCVIAPGEPVVIPATSEKADYEAELAVVIGRRAKHVRADRAYDYVLGYTAFNDVTARDFQFGDGQWQRGKSCDTFAPMGQTIVTTDEIPDPHTLRITLTLNGAVMQDSNTSSAHLPRAGAHRVHHEQHHAGAGRRHRHWHARRRRLCAEAAGVPQARRRDGGRHRAHRGTRQSGRSGGEVVARDSCVASPRDVAQP